ncbi:hypothetical protein CROQUDRAFT_673825 [Cronartium quercuum f. sp. fusiforme G11]|uniref:Calcineurin-like phosphoesterase domain-containing protein n=1 Tax=Cronartium quercuum f. sp. fusiforme G11 TaxID=708437 RepID=A0A9P6T7Y8_9BASI|nr:hypothetical protein CROQUDRAFT_673825 [Cronartium quercuum f. sp. fusiforme G11]
MINHKTNKTRKTIILILKIIWTIALIYGEWYEFYNSVNKCEWPSIPPLESDLDENRVRFNVLIIADPQLPSIKYSYPKRSLLLRYISLQVIYQFIRKSWRFVIHNTKPDAIVFLGDLLDGGVATTNEKEYEGLVNRFRSTFPIPNTINQTNRVIYLAGNHDLGLKPSINLIDSNLAKQRFIKNWSNNDKLSGLIEWGNHTIIWIDSIGLIEQEKEEEKVVESFIKDLNGPEMLLPKVLFSHIPLWRPEETNCGIERESKRVIKQGKGINYQNEIPEKVTKLVLEKIEPTIIFSGDDHDYCDIIHTLPSKSYANPTLSIHEISVKSFSMGMGILNPGYQLLTLSNPTRYSKLPEEQTTFESSCLLPNQIKIYTKLYLPLFIISLIIIILPSFIEKKSVKKLRQKQARTNGLPIHRKNLSRNKFNFKNKNVLTDSSSENENKSDEETLTNKLISQHSRRSDSMSINLEQLDELNSPTLSYHSPIDSGHEDDSHPSYTRRLTSKRPALPSKHSNNHNRSNGLLSSIFGRRRVNKWTNKSSRSFTSYRILKELWSLSSLIFLIYGIIWFWFWW